MATDVTTWSSARLGFAALLLDSLTVALLFRLAVAFMAGAGVPAICLALACFGGARLCRSVDRKRAPAAMVRAVVTASMLALCLLTSLPGPPPPEVGEDVRSVVERLGPPSTGCCSSEPGQDESEEDTLRFGVTRFGQAVLYVVHVRDGRVAGTEVLTDR